MSGAPYTEAAQEETFLEQQERRKKERESFRGKLPPLTKWYTWLGVPCAILFAAMCGLAVIDGVQTTGLLPIWGALSAGAVTFTVNFIGMITAVPYVLRKIKETLTGGDGFLRERVKLAYTVKNNPNDPLSDTTDEELYVTVKEDKRVRNMVGYKRTIFYIFALFGATTTSVLFTALFASGVKNSMGVLGIGAGIATSLWVLVPLCAVSILCNFSLAVNSASNELSKNDIWSRVKAFARNDQRRPRNPGQILFKMLFLSLAVYGVYATFLSGAVPFTEFVFNSESAASFLKGFGISEYSFRTGAVALGMLGYCPYTLIAVNRLADKIIALPKTLGNLFGDMSKTYSAAKTEGKSAVVATLVVFYEHVLKTIPMWFMGILGLINASNNGTLAAKNTLDDTGGMREVGLATQIESSVEIAGGSLGSAAYFFNAGDPSDKETGHEPYAEIDTHPVAEGGTKHLCTFNYYANDGADSTPIDNNIINEERCGTVETRRHFGYNLANNL